MDKMPFTELGLLASVTSITGIEDLCNNAMKSKAAAVCVPPMYLKLVKSITSNTPVKTAAVVGFPFGYNAIESKLAETVLAIVDGANEIHLMINLIAIKNKDWQYLARELNTLLAVVRKSERSLIVIIEAGTLNEEEIIACCDIYGAAGVDFIKTATGFSNEPVTIKTLTFIRRHLADAVGIIYVYEQTLKYNVNDLKQAGVDRIAYLDNTNSVKEIENVQGGMVFENKL